MFAVTLNLSETLHRLLDQSQTKTFSYIKKVRAQRV